MRNMLRSNNQRNKYLNRSRIISGIIVIPFPLLGILLMPILGLGESFYYSISLPAILLAGVISKIIFNRLIDRDKRTIFGKIVLFLNDHIWSHNP